MSADQRWMCVCTLHQLISTWRCACLFVNANSENILFVDASYTTVQIQNLTVNVPLCTDIRMVSVQKRCNSGAEQPTRPSQRCPFICSSRSVLSV